MRPLITHLEKIPKNVLMIGNSFMYYNNGADSFAAGLCREIGIHTAFTMITISGGSLSWHPLNCYLDAPHMHEFIPGHDDQLHFIDKNKFDAVILQDNSQGPIHPKLAPLFEEFINKFCQEISARGSMPLIMMTWAYENKPEMTEKLLKATIKAANENNAMMIPVGLAFERCRKDFTEIALTVEDKHHPTPAGTYLEACMIEIALTNKRPEYKGFNGIGNAKVKYEDILKLQKIAWETALNFYN